MRVQAHAEAVSRREEELNSFTWNVAGKGGGILQGLTFPVIFPVMKPGSVGYGWEEAERPLCGKTSPSAWSLTHPSSNPEPPNAPCELKGVKAPTYLPT